MNVEKLTHKGPCYNDSVNDLQTIGFANVAKWVGTFQVSVTPYLALAKVKDDGNQSLERHLADVVRLSRLTTTADL